MVGKGEGKWGEMVEVVLERIDRFCPRCGCKQLKFP